MEILKRALTDTIYDEELREKFFNKTLSYDEVNSILAEGIRDSYVCDGRVIPLRADTMVGKPRLDNFQLCIERVIRDGIDGDIIETGVWRGGSCILAAAIIDLYKSNKKIYVADSFEGLPIPEEDLYPADKNDPHHTLNYLRVSLEQVKENFNKYGYLNDNVIFIKGFFKNSLKEVPFDKLSVLRLDGDMYSSTWEVLIRLYDKVENGGYVIIDDYALPACKQAVDDFRRALGIVDKIIQVDWTGVYWQKTI